MDQAHQGFTNLELGNPHTNQLVDALKEAGTPKGIYGAKASAAGQGGTVIALCKGQQGIDTAAEVLAKYAQNSNLKTGLFTGSSDGAFFEESKALSF